MIRSIYTAAANMVAQLNRQIVVANNVANIDTPGYKQDLAVMEGFADMFLQNLEDPGADPIGVLGTGVLIPQVTLDLQQGELFASGHPYDLGLAGPGFFVIQTADGIRYTRAGAFQRNADGALTTSSGGLVMGQSGPITLPLGRDVRVAADGRILVDNVEADRLQLVEFPGDALLRKVGDGYLVPENATAAAATQTVVSQGFLEQSNVDVARAMSELMAAKRAYQANLQIIQLQDQTLALAVNEIGRLA